MNILYINACARKNSRTNELAKYLLNKLNGNIEELNIYCENIFPFDEQLLEKRDTLLSQKDYNNALFKQARQFSNADLIIIAAPYWDLSFPSILKTYIENINVSGITFQYTEKGYPESYFTELTKLII